MSSSVAYKIKNWSQYNKALVNRGNVTVWLNEDTRQGWNPQLPQTLRGRPYQYSDLAIECALTFKSLFHLPLRATQGFLQSLMCMLKLDLVVPDYTTLCRRAKDLSIDLKKSIRPSQAIDIVIDSTGLKIYGEGEWKMRIHGKQKRRTWRKLHIAVDPNSHETLSMALTSNRVADMQVLPGLLDGQDSIKKVYADGAYYAPQCLDAIATKGAHAVIPPRYGSSLPIPPGAGPGLAMKYTLMQESYEHGSTQNWKKQSGYHKRSLVETQMYRYKQIFGCKLHSRKMSNQVVEARIKLSILNKMTQMGMPKTESVVI